MMAAVVKQRSEPGVSVSSRILEVRDTDVSDHLPLSSVSGDMVQIVMAKLLDPGPVLVLSFQAQQLTIKTRAGEERQVFNPIITIIIISYVMMWYTGGIAGECVLCVGVV